MSQRENKIKPKINKETQGRYHQVISTLLLNTCISFGIEVKKKYIYISMCDEQNYCFRNQIVIILLYF